MKKCAPMVISMLLMLCVFQMLLVSLVFAQEQKDANLYFYGDGQEGGNLSTSAPTSSGYEYMDVGPTGGVFIMWIYGTYETPIFVKDISIEGDVMIHLWVEQIATTPGIVQFNCDVLINGLETGITLEGEQVIVTEVHEITFGGHMNLPVTTGDVLGLYITLHYSGTNMNIYWGSTDYPSHIVVPGDWVHMTALDPVINQNNQRVTISVDAIHALGTDELIDFQLDIDGPSGASSINGPNTVISGDTITVTWDWMYGSDGAVEGAYTATIEITDKSGNIWDDSSSFQVSYYTPPPPPPPPPDTDWITLNPITWHQERDRYPSLMQDKDGTYWMTWSRREGYWDYDIYVKNSPDGKNWSNAMPVTTNNSYELYPCMIQDSDGVYWLAFTSDWGYDYCIWITNSTDGLNWGAPHRIISHRYDNFQPSLIQASDGTYWIAWAHLNWSTGNYDIRVTSSLDGMNWDDNCCSITTDNYYDYSPSFIQDSTGVFRIAWASERYGDPEIVVSTSTNPQYTWTTPGRITMNDSWDSRPSLIENVDGGFNISWESDRSEDNEIWFSGSSDWTSWTQPEIVTQYENPQTEKFAPSLIQDAHETLWIAWYGWSANSDDIWLSYKETNDPPSIVISSPSEEQTGNVSIDYFLKDSGCDACCIQPEFSCDGITFQSATMGSGGHGIVDLSSSPSGIPHKFVWASKTDIPTSDEESVYFRITPRDCQEGEVKTTDAFQVDNNAEPTVQIEPIEGVQSKTIAFTYTVSDEESEKLSIIPEYSIDGENFQHATMGDDSDKIKNIKSSPSGKTYTYVWDTAKNLEDADEEEVYFRITAEDYEAGMPDTTSAFHVDNKAPTITSGPQVGSITDTSVVISWETDEPSDGIVYYGRDVNYGDIKEGAINSTSHSMAIDSLEPETEYHFYVTSTDFVGNGPTESIDDVFTTDQPPNDPPTVSITSLQDKDKVDGTITIHGDASDVQGDDTIEFIEVKIDEDDWVRAEGKKAWRFKLDSTDLKNGKHYLTVRAYDGRDYSQEISVEFEVDNEDDTMIIWIAILAGLFVLGAIILYFARKKAQRPQVVTSRDFDMTQPREFVPLTEPVVSDAQIMVAEPVYFEAPPPSTIEPVSEYEYPPQ